MTGPLFEDNAAEINLLPDEIIHVIFRCLPLDSLLQCENVCKRWKKLVRDPTLWRNIVIVYSGKPGQTEVSEKNLEILTTHNNYIRRVKLQYVYNYSFIISVLEKCYNLISLELVMCRLCKEFEYDIRKWPRLRKLSLRNSLLLQNSTDMLISFDYFKNLTHLALADFGLSSFNFNTLISCNHLNHIFIEKIKNISMCDVKALLLAKRETLLSLHIYGASSIDDKCLNLMSQCNLLHDLAIIRCESLTDEGLLPLATLKNIQHLQLWNNNNFTELALLTTLGCSTLFKLQSLSLSRIGNMSPVIVDVISEYYKHLKFLALYQCPRIINTDYEKQLKSKFRNIDVVLY